MHLRIGGVHLSRVVERDEEHAIILHFTLKALVLLGVVH
jgi:hypothetical protein